MDLLENLVSQNILINVGSRTMIPTGKAVILRGTFKIHMPLDLVIAYLHEDPENNSELTQIFAKLESISIQYKIIQGDTVFNCPKVINEGTSIKRSQAAFSTSLLIINGPKYTDLLSNKSISSANDSYLDLQRCMHYDFELTAPLPPEADQQPLYAEFTLFAFCSRQDSLYPGRRYLYLGPRMEIPLRPKDVGGHHDNMIIAAGKPPYLIRADARCMQDYMQQRSEIELFYGDSYLSNLPKAFQLQRLLVEYRDLHHWMDRIVIE